MNNDGCYETQESKLAAIQDNRDESLLNLLSAPTNKAQVYIHTYIHTHLFNPLSAPANEAQVRNSNLHAKSR